MVLLISSSRFETSEGPLRCTWHTYSCFQAFLSINRFYPCLACKAFGDPIEWIGQLRKFCKHVFFVVFFLFNSTLFENLLFLTMKIRKKIKAVSEKVDDNFDDEEKLLEQDEDVELIANMSKNKTSSVPITTCRLDSVPQDHCMEFDNIFLRSTFLQKIVGNTDPK